MNRARDARAYGASVDDGVGRQGSAKLLATLGYMAGIALMVWGLLSGSLVLIPLGLLILGIVLVTAG